MDVPEVPSELVEQIVKGNGVLFVGAGLSMGAGLPSWPGLMRKMLNWCEEHDVNLADERAEIEDSIDAGELLLVAQELRERMGKDRFRRFMVEVFRKPDIKPIETHQILSEIPFAAILTTNYDVLLESTYAPKLGIIPRAYNQVDTAELSALAREEEFYILKVHGDIDHIETVVLGQGDYRQVMFGNEAYRRFLQTLFMTKTVFFLGFSMTDPDLLFFLDEMRAAFKGYGGIHYALMSDVSRLKVRRFDQDYGIQVISYKPSDKTHPEVKAFLESLRDQVEMRRQEMEAEQVQVVEVPVKLLPFDSFVDEVKVWPEVMGYIITDEQKGDDYIDLVASLQSGLMRQQVLVRCIEGKITRDRLEALEQAMKNRDIASSWAIADQRVTKGARAYAKGNDAIEAFNLADFMRQMFSNYFDYLTDLVESSDIPHYYVDLDCYEIHTDEEGRETGRERYEVIDDYIDAWLQERGRMHISLLGEFGSGKTWFCRHYAYRQLQRFLEDPVNQRLPLLFTLREYAKAMDVSQLINSALLDKYRLPFVGSAFEAFERMNRRGKLLLIFDGFDEMARKVEYQTVVDNFWELARVVVPNSKVLLTCRTPYFRYAKESEKVLGGEELGRRTIIIEPPKFEVLYLELFTDEQIEEVIVKRVGPENGPAVTRRILDTLNLAELARKPVLIELLLAVLPEIEVREEINEAQVYLYATNELLLRNITAERTFTTTADKLFFLCELAWEMIRSGELRIHYADIPERIQAWFGDRIKDKPELDHWDYDLRNQTLLQRDAAGYYEFAHKSLAEYFVAYKFAAELGCLAPEFTQTYCEADGRPCALPIVQEDAVALVQTFGAFSLSDERMWAIRDLLSGMVGDTAQLWAVIGQTKGKTFEDVHYTGGNAATLLRMKGESFEGAKLARTVLTGADLHNTDLTEADLAGAVLTGVNLSQADLTGASLHETNLSRSILSGTCCRGCNFVWAVLTDAKLRGASVPYANFSHARMRGADLGKTTGLGKTNLFEEADVDGVRFTDYIELSDGVLTWRTGGRPCDRIKALRYLTLVSFLPGAREVALAKISDPSPGVRMASIALLSRSISNSDAEDIFKSMIKDRSAGVRLAIAHELATFERSTTVVQLLEHLSRDSHPDVEREALRVLCDMEDE